jgi:hypothetical protein
MGKARPLLRGTGIFLDQLPPTELERIAHAMVAATPEYRGIISKRTKNPALVLMSD